MDKVLTIIVGLIVFLGVLFLGLYVNKGLKAIEHYDNCPYHKERLTVGSLTFLKEMSTITNEHDEEIKDLEVKLVLLRKQMREERRDFKY